MTRSAKRFLLVDDDPLNNSISKMMLKTFGEVEVKDFIFPELALAYIENEYEHQEVDGKTTIFLDINMPNLTGWEFLDKFGTYTESKKNQFNIYMLSSSVNPADVQRSKQHPLIIDFIEKPLNKAVITSMMEKSL